MSVVARPADARGPASRRRLVGRRITDLATHPDQWVTPEAIAEHYGVPLKTVTRKWRAQSAADVERGLLEMHDFPGRHTRVRVRALIEFERRHGIVPKPT